MSGRGKGGKGLGVLSAPSATAKFFEITSRVLLRHSAPGSSWWCEAHLRAHLWGDSRGAGASWERDSRRGRLHRVRQAQDCHSHGRGLRAQRQGRTLYGFGGWVSAFPGIEQKVLFKGPHLFIWGAVMLCFWVFSVTLYALTLKGTISTLRCECLVKFTLPGNVLNIILDFVTLSGIFGLIA